ncbi:hypothetical protein M1506_01915 [Patescibacteria group bacterium]|nr:hypothetical protein [Patescibacteria group bacterium]
MKVQNFSENLESSLTRLGAEVSKKMNSPEFKEAPVETVVKSSLKSLPLPVVTAKPGESDTSSKPENDDEMEKFLPSYLAEDEKSDEVKSVVENLINFSLKEGIEEAIAEAKKYPPFVEDAFHDALTDKLLPELKKRGIIK